MLLLPFGNRSGVGGDALSELAYDAAADLLERSARFTVLRRKPDELHSVIGPHYGYGNGRTLAEEAGVTAWAEGDVVHLNEAVVRDKHIVQAGVWLVMYETRSGYAVAAAADYGPEVVIGASNRNAAIAEAVRKGTEQAVRDALAIRLAEAEVVGPAVATDRADGYLIPLSQSGKERLRKGMRMTIWRAGREIVHSFTIRSARRQNAEAVVIGPAPNVQSGDGARELLLPTTVIPHRVR